MQSYQQILSAQTLVCTIIATFDITDYLLQKFS